MPDLQQADPKRLGRTNEVRQGMGPTHAHNHPTPREEEEGKGRRKYKQWAKRSPRKHPKKRALNRAGKGPRNAQRRQTTPDRKRAQKPTGHRPKRRETSLKTGPQGQPQPAHTGTRGPPPQSHPDPTGTREIVQPTPHGGSRLRASAFCATILEPNYNGRSRECTRSQPKRNWPPIPKDEGP